MEKKKRNSYAAILLLLGGLILGGVFLQEGGNENKGKDRSEKNKEHLSSQVKEIKKYSKKKREEILQKTLGKEVTSLPLFQNFLDSDREREELNKEIRENKKEAKLLITKSFNSLKKCYHEGCGQEADLEDGFFDPALTVAQSQLTKLLQMTRDNRKELEMDSWPSQEELMELLDAENEELRQEAFGSIVDIYGKEKAFSQILHKTRELNNSEAAGTAIKKLLSLVDKNNKQDFIDILATINAEKESATILGILEELEDFTLTQEQLNQLTDGLCRFKDDPSESHNVKAMSYYLKTMASNSKLREERNCLF